MKGAFLALFIAVLLLVAAYFKLDVYTRGGTIDLHLHDTYFVLSYTVVIVFLLLFLGTFFAIGGVIGSRFQRKGFWILALVFLALDAGVAWYGYTLFKEAEPPSFPTTGSLLHNATTVNA